MYASLRPIGTWLAAAVAAAAAAAAEPTAVPWLGVNLVTNAGFEQAGTPGAAPPGWSALSEGGGAAEAVADEADALEGRRSLRLTSPGVADGGIAAVSAPFAVAAGAKYLFSVAFRQEGFNTNGAPGAYAGVSASPTLTWLDAQRRPIGRSGRITRFPYGPSAWDLRDAFETAPASAAYAQVEIRVINAGRRTCGRPVAARLWVDAVQVRAYRPPPTPAWATGPSARVVEGAAANEAVRTWFAGSDDAFQKGRGGQWSRPADDPLAERGVALEARASAGEGIMAHSPYFPALPPGLYRLRARVRLPAGVAAESGPAGYLDVDTLSSGVRLAMPFEARADVPAGAYADYEGDFILRDAGWWDIRLYTHGRSVWHVDSIKVFPLHELSDRELLAIYPGSEGAPPPADLLPAPYVPVLGGPVRPLRVLVVAGMGYERFRLAAALRLLHRDTVIQPVWVRSVNGVPGIPGLPATAEECFQYALVCLCDVSLRGVPLRTRTVLREYVRRGGALLVLGGHQAYERGGWRGSLLEETLPVETAAAPAGGVLAFPRGAPVLGVPGSPVFGEGRPVETGAVACYLHAVRVKPGGAVWARAGEHPFLVGGAFERGRVVCALGLPYGEAPAETTPFWEWSGWVDLLRDACWWALQHGGEFDTWNRLQAVQVEAAGMEPERLKQTGRHAAGERLGDVRGRARQGRLRNGAARGGDFCGGGRTGMIALYELGRHTDCWGTVWNNIARGFDSIVVQEPLADWAAFDEWKRHLPNPETDGEFGPRQPWAQVETGLAAARARGDLAWGGGIMHGFFLRR
jgi:hypothetical protein